MCRQPPRLLSSSSSCETAASAVSRISTYQRRLTTILLDVLLLFLACFVILTIAYVTSLSVRRTVTFWRGMLPLYLEYKWLQWRQPYLPASVYQERLQAYYERAAQTVVQLITRLGGLATKIGQILATAGQGLLPDPVVVALKVLQNGVPPKSYDEIAAIIESSGTHQDGRPYRMDELFSWFDPQPLGAASIAQAHLARLRHNNQTVVVKVQYPEIALQLRADLWNVQTAVRLLSGPDNAALAQAVADRHTRELDFRLEADHLREVTAHLQEDGVEPQLVRLPRVYNETGLCSRNVLVMEYLPGVPLQTVLDEEQARLARALLGRDASMQDLQQHLTDQLKGLRPSGGAPRDGFEPRASTTKLPVWMTHPVLQTVGAALLRTYAGVRDHWGHASLWIRQRVQGRPLNDAHGPRYLGYGKVNVARVLRTLVHVHGLQLLMHGVFNTDPHPGNVLVMPDGRLGLLDYGMIGRMSDTDRSWAVETVLSLADGDIHRTANLYTAAGYQAQLRVGPPGVVQDAGILHRFATFHWDRIDLSPVTWTSTGETQDILHVLQGVVEPRVPPWIEDGRRLGALLMGPHIQSGRPGFSLANSWKRIAKKAQAKLRRANVTSTV